MAVPERSSLRLADLKARAPKASRLMNVKVPVSIVTAIEHLAKRLEVSKTDVIVTLLNEELDVAKVKTPKRKAGSSR